MYMCVSKLQSWKTLLNWLISPIPYSSWLAQLRVVALPFTQCGQNFHETRIYFHISTTSLNIFRLSEAVLPFWCHCLHFQMRPSKNYGTIVPSLPALPALSTTTSMVVIRPSISIENADQRWRWRFIAQSMLKSQAESLPWLLAHIAKPKALKW